jgi:hypothetical protein
MPIGTAETPVTTRIIAPVEGIRAVLLQLGEWPQECPSNRLQGTLLQ